MDSFCQHLNWRGGNNIAHLGATALPTAQANYDADNMLLYDFTAERTGAAEFSPRTSMSFAQRATIRSDDAASNVLRQRFETHMAKTGLREPLLQT